REPADQQPLHRAPPKITLFNRPYETSLPSTAEKASSPSTRGTGRIMSSDGEEDEHGEGSGKVQFVKPKEKSPNDVSLSRAGSSGFGSSRDPLKKPAPSKLTVMLKCLSGDLDDYEEEEEVQPAPRLPSAATTITQPSSAGFSFGAAPAKDIVDAPKQLPTSGASKPDTVPVSDTVTIAASAATPSTTVSNGLSALINNPIKDNGLGKTASPQPSKEPTTETSSAKPNEAKQDAPTAEPTTKSLTFSFGTATTTSPSAIGTTPAASAGFSLPLKPSTTATTTVGPSSMVPTATFSFGTPIQKSTASATSPLAALSSSNMISFSPAAAKLPTPVLQFGGSPVSTVSATVTTASATAPSSTPMFSFTASTTTVAAATTTTTTTSALAAPPSSISSPPTFGAGTTFGGFKLPSSVTLSTTSSAQPPSNTLIGTTATSSSPATVTPAFSFGFSAAKNP
uniref:Uncharacterized protein n=1 Tax=Anopheles maculatus TaxID=74869 RepID=A0A182SM49_9DIPT